MKMRNEGQIFELTTKLETIKGMCCQIINVGRAIVTGKKQPYTTPLIQSGPYLSVGPECVGNRGFLHV